MEKTDNGISYELVSSGSKKDINLYPIKGNHKAKDIQRAKFFFRKKYGAARVQVRWIIRDDPDFEPPSRLPDEIIISKLRQELGSAEEYIAELEERLENMPVRIEREKGDLKEIRRESLYRKIQEDLTKSKKLNNRLKRDNAELVHRIVMAGLIVPPKLIHEDEDTGDSQQHQD